MASRSDPSREHALLEAIAFATERLLGPSDQLHLPEVLGALGRAASVSHVVLVAASVDGGPASAMPPRMEVRQQWTATGVARLQPANSGWQRYPARWPVALAAGTTLAGPARAFPSAERTVIEGLGIQSLLLVPVFVGDRWYGHLAASDTMAERIWTPGEIEALRAAAGIIGSGILHRQALAAAERRSAVLASVGEATALLLEAQNWRAALPRVLDNLRTTTRTRSAWAYGPDPGQPGSRVVQLYEVRAPGTRLGGAHARTLDLTPESAALLAQGHPVHDGLPVATPDPLRDALALRGVASWLMVPMILEPGEIGLVGLDSDRPRTWTEGEVEGLHVLAGALRAAIRRGGTLVSVPVVANPWGSSETSGGAGEAGTATPAGEPATTRTRMPSHEAPELGRTSGRTEGGGNHK
jgi:GAF domain-containing protein